MRKCRICGERYTATRSIQPTCGKFECMCAYAETVAKKAADKRAKDSRGKAKTRLAELKTIPQLIAEADREFMAYIRLRDQTAGHRCISSGRVLDWTGNAVDAGHYRSRGAASHLRYDEANCHAQSKHDNRYLGGNIVAYRVGLIARIGIEEVERIENDNAPVKWTREKLTQIIQEYRRKKKELARNAKS